ncbi:hypothetical protein DERF_007882 [Dermatophagoides farinae]|uniref:Metallothionein n=1 Tax=Dermatophagoides farinae TaxID=6954 RepID=A0A922L6F4_DERFA|nr:hypothetical protein DERF_007882 [Dermatophagoides farinae]
MQTLAAEKMRMQCKGGNCGCGCCANECNCDCCKNCGCHCCKDCNCGCNCRSEQLKKWNSNNK